jgi:O-antigen ligase
MLHFLRNRSTYETLFVVLVTVLFGLAIGMMGALSLKFQVALGIAMFGFMLIMVTPHRRTLCLCLYVMIQPLSIEKILFVDAPIWSGLRGQELIINAGDLVLMLLAAILITERLITHKPRFVVDKKALLFLTLLVWATISYLTHLLFYQSNFMSNAPLGLLHLTRNFLFVVIIGSAIKTRSDVIWILLAVLFMLVFESVLVSLSFATHKTYTFMSLIGGTQFIQSYSGTSGNIVRAVGTLGVANQQGLFHAMFTFLVIGLFAVRNPIVRYSALVAILMSFIAVIFTFSRGSWLCIALASMLIAGIFVKRAEVAQRAWLIGGVVMIVFFVALTALAQPILDRLTKGDDGATGSRLRMMSLAIDLFAQYPIIGVGPLGFTEAGLRLYPPGTKSNEWVPAGDKPIVPPLGRIELARAVVPGQADLVVPLPVHNKYLLTLSELGLVGLLIWVLIFYLFYQDAKQCSLSKDRLYRFMGVSGLGITFVAALYMNLDLFADDKTLQVLLFPLVLVSACSRLARQQANTIKSANLSRIQSRS